MPCSPRPRSLPLLALPLSVPLAASVALWSPAASADPDEIRPVTWDMSVEQLQEIGLGQYRGDAIPVPADAPLQHDPADPAKVKQGVIFVNFDGATLSSGYDNSINNTTQIGQLAGSFAAYGAGSKRDATMQAVREDWAAYNVIVTDVRPASGDYTMNMTGPTNPFGGGVLGIAPLDCNDSQTHNNITYAFHSANDQHSASTQATTIGQEVAHSYGLEHVNEPGDIMNPYNAGGDPSFRDECIAIVQGTACGSQHAAQCGSSGSQNSHAELMALFGSAAPDMGPPTVAITYPADGAEFDAGASFDITADATDDAQVTEVRLYIDGDLMGTDASDPYSWGVNQIPEGTYELYAIATDLAGNEAMSDVVTIGVGGAPATTSGGSTGGDDSGGTGGDDSGGTGGDSTGDPTGDSGDTGYTTGGHFPPGYGVDEDRDGCACTFDRTPSGAAAWMLVILGAGLRRRR